MADGVQFLPIPIYNDQDATLIHLILVYRHPKVVFFPIGNRCFENVVQFRYLEQIKT
jgi:hypothetical protein